MRNLPLGGQSMHGLGVQFMEIGSSYHSICKDSHACFFHTREMLFHSLSGGEMHGVIDEMDRRSKGESAAISSAIDRGETETVGRETKGFQTKP